MPSSVSTVCLFSRTDVPMKRSPFLRLCHRSHSYNIHRKHQCFLCIIVDLLFSSLYPSPYLALGMSGALAGWATTSCFSAVCVCC